MAEVWYASIEPRTRLTQGDLIMNCPLVGWKEEIARIEGVEEAEMLMQQVDAFAADTVVMTQACDLEHEKIVNVVLCPHYGLAEHRQNLTAAMKARGQILTEKAWRRHCEDISQGLIWNLGILNSLTEGLLTTDHRVVDFTRSLPFRGCSSKVLSPTEISRASVCFRHIGNISPKLLPDSSCEWDCQFP